MFASLPFVPKFRRNIGLARTYTPLIATGRSESTNLYPLDPGLRQASMRFGCAPETDHF